MKENMLTLACDRLYYINLIRKERINCLLDIIFKNTINMMHFCTKYGKTGEKRTNFRLFVRINNKLYVKNSAYLINKNNDGWKIYFKGGDPVFITKMINIDIINKYTHSEIDAMYEFRINDRMCNYLNKLPTETARILVFFTSQYESSNEMIELVKTDYLSKEYLAFSLLIIDKKIEEITKNYI